MISCLDKEISSDKTQHSFIYKLSTNKPHKDSILTKTVIYVSTELTSYSEVKKKGFSPETRKGCPLSPHLFNTVVLALARVIRQEKN